jgi:hypothetical protein
MCQSFIPPKQTTVHLKPLVSCNNSNGMITNLLHIICSQQWSALKKIDLSTPDIFQMICSIIPKYKEFKGMTLLHACLRYSHPLGVVIKMVNMVGLMMQMHIRTLSPLRRVFISDTKTAFVYIRIE